MSRLDEFIKSLANGEIEYLNEILPSIDIFLDSIEKEDLICEGQEVKEVKKLMQYIDTLNAMSTLNSNIFSIFANRPTAKLKINVLKGLGLHTENIAQQFLGSMCNSIQVSTEKLKIHLLVSINYPSLTNEKRLYKKTLGELLGILKNYFKNDKFLNSLSTEIRNPVAHYTYYFENNRIWLCDSLFDENPKGYSLEEFLIICRKYEILTDTYFLRFLDRYKKPTEEPVMQYLDINE